MHYHTMKTPKLLIMTALILSAMAVAGCGNKTKQASSETSTEVVKNDTVFHEFDVVADFQGNPFTMFKGHGALLAVGDEARHNAMTIGWGALGNLWGENINTVIVYVAPARYTHEFMEQYPYFTVMTFDPEYTDILDYMGSHSGRDVNKEKELGLHVAYTPHGAPYYTEAREVYECETIYRNPFNPEGFGELGHRRYENFPAGIHSEYIGRILGAWRK